MTHTNTDALAKAIAALGAVEVAPGRYAFPSNATPNRWWLCGEANIALTAASMGDRAVRHDFTNLKACVLAPAWWAPERRECRKVSYANGTVYVAEDDYRQHGAPRGARVERITADVETGQEVSA